MFVLTRCPAMTRACSCFTLVLVSLALEPEPRLTVNTENIVLGGMAALIHRDPLPVVPK